MTTTRAQQPARRPRKRRQRYTDTEDFGKMVERMLRAYGVRVGEADVEDLRQLARLRSLVDDILVESIGNMRSTTGYSWKDIGEALGVTRQSAQERYGRRR